MSLLYVATCLTCVSQSFCSGLFRYFQLFQSCYLPVLTSVKRRPVCWDCKGSNLIYIVKNLFSFFPFCFSGFPECLAFKLNTKTKTIYSFISLSNLYSFILFTLSLPPKRSANVGKNSSPQNNSSQILV